MFAQWQYQTFRRSLDHLLRAADYPFGGFEAARLGGLEVGVQDRQFARLFAFENTGGAGASDHTPT
jgi:hypothetical protein